MELLYKNEKKLFFVSAVISGVFWLALILGTLGIALIYLLFGYLFFLFAHSAFISHLKGSGVRISEEQYPDLYQRVVSASNKAGVKEIPDAYLLRTDFFNALATRFLGRHFIVLFTDVVDALDDQQGAIDFYIGHELGHIHRKHLLWSTFLMPASILPLLGAALRRAEEYTCDRYGVACCESSDDITAALAAVAAGDTRWKSINVDAYVGQVAASGGFWMSFNELTSDYPWLSKRMATSIALAQGQEIKHPRRHSVAWLLSIFVPRFGSGGMASLMVTIVTIGILAAVALPAYQDYTQKARVSAAYSAALPIKTQVSKYVLEKQAWPSSLQDLGHQNASLENATASFEISIFEDGIIGADIGDDENGDTMYIVLEPLIEEGNLSWQCYGQNLASKLLPPPCRE